MTTETEGGAMRFASSSGPALTGRLEYSTGEHAFDFLPDSGTDLDQRVGCTGTTSLLVDTLQLEVDRASGALLYAWGFYPRGPWVPAPVDPGPCREGLIHRHLTQPLLRGVSERVPGTEAWVTEWDESTGWVRIGAESRVDDERVRIAPGTVIGLTRSRMSSVWLRAHFGP